MIKLMSQLPDGRTLVVLGLSDANVERLKKDEPIVFDMEAYDLPRQAVAISWKHDDGQAGFPAGFAGIGLCFSSEALEAMKTWPQVLDNGAYRFTVFRGTDEQTMERDVRGLIGPETKVTHRGFSPSNVPQSMN